MPRHLWLFDALLIISQMARFYFLSAPGRYVRSQCADLQGRLPNTFHLHGRTMLVIFPGFVATRHRPIRSRLRYQTPNLCLCSFLITYTRPTTCNKEKMLNGSQPTATVSMRCLAARMVLTSIERWHWSTYREPRSSMPARRY
jgi:hypothetical protein